MQAFKYRGIPIVAVKNMVLGVCKGLDFLHRKCKIIHTDLKPENVLLCFNPNLCNDDSTTSILSVDSRKVMSSPNTSKATLSIQDLERELENPNLSSDERKRLRNRLKKKRQKEMKQDNILQDTSSDLTDISIRHLLATSSNSKQNTVPTSPNRVLSRLSHSAFLAKNFSAQQHCGTKWTDVLSKIEVSCMKKTDDQLDNPDKNAKITFLLRAFGPEGEVADNLSHALGVKWEKSIDKSASREW